jgi:hypothetical protein
MACWYLEGSAPSPTWLSLMKFVDTAMVESRDVNRDLLLILGQVETHLALSQHSKHFVQLYVDPVSAVLVAQHGNLHLALRLIL